MENGKVFSGLLLGDCWFVGNGLGKFLGSVKGNWKFKIKLLFDVDWR